MESYFVVSHGGSMTFPLLVGEEVAKELKKHGVRVLTREEYMKEHGF